MLKKSRREDGVAAVEFALVLPLLLVLLFGIIEFGLLLNKQISVSNGAREAVRYAAIHYADTDVVTQAQARADETAGFLDGITTTVNVATCTPGVLGYATARVEVPPALVTGWFNELFDAGFMVTGEGRMICGG